MGIASYMVVVAAGNCLKLVHRSLAVSPPPAFTCMWVQCFCSWASWPIMALVAAGKFAKHGTCSLAVSPSDLGMSLLMHEKWAGLESLDVSSRRGVVCVCAWKGLFADHGLSWQASDGDM